MPVTAKMAPPPQCFFFFWHHIKFYRVLAAASDNAVFSSKYFRAFGLPPFLRDDLFQSVCYIFYRYLSTASKQTLLRPKGEAASVEGSKLLTMPHGRAKFAGSQARGGSYYYVTNRLVTNRLTPPDGAVGSTKIPPLNQYGG